MSAANSQHTHPETWPAFMDWLDLRGHLINIHRANPKDVDDLAPYADGVAGRRRHAEDRHRALHLATLPSMPG